MKGGENMISKKIILPVVVLAIVGTAAFGVAQVNAQTSNQPFANMVEAISQKFGLDKTKVQSVVEEVHKQNQEKRQAMMQQRLEEKLTQDVKDGKITEAQKNAIINKMKQLRSNMTPGAMKDKTPEERKTEMDTKKTEITNWAKSQGIDPNYLMELFGRGGMHKQGWAKPQ